VPVPAPSLDIGPFPSDGGDVAQKNPRQCIASRNTMLHAQGHDWLAERSLRCDAK
jgi:hypothetical protein